MNRIFKVTSTSGRTFYIEKDVGDESNQTITDILGMPAMNVEEVKTIGELFTHIYDDSA